MKDIGRDSVEFVLNGQNVTVSDANANTLLIEYLRHTALLTGTKWMCREGGCGACMVTLVTADPVTQTNNYRAVNACMLPLLSCHGKEIITVEGIGNKKDGLHPIQNQLAEMNGSQCGYCSPGMVMSMYSLFEKKEGNLTVKDVESSLEGNICRCTGYRPIMDAFKTFAKDAPPHLKAQQCVDLEDLGSLIGKFCQKKGGPCTGSCNGASNTNGHGKSGMFQRDNWYRPESLKELAELLGSFEKGTKYRLVAGNTGTGVYKNDGPYEFYVDVTAVTELYQTSESTPLTIGGGVSLTNMMELLISAGASNPDYWYGPILAEHIGKIGSVPVRNAGSVAGNLMLKHDHHEFPSDLFIVLETVSSKINIMNQTGKIEQLSLVDFLHSDMEGKVVLSLNLPALTTDHVIRTFKIMPRTGNAHAYINAGFCARVVDHRIVEKPTVIYGGIRSDLVHAEKTEDYLNGKNLSDEKDFKSALEILEKELSPKMDLLAPDDDYLKGVAQGLLYKFALKVVGGKAPVKVRSGALNLDREISSGKQEFDTDEKQWPLNQPTMKVEAKAQCSGEAQYVGDITMRPDELFGAFVVSTVANCSLDSIDPSEALNAEGVVAFYDANNSKHGNIFIPINHFDNVDEEEIFCSGKVLYAGQSLGLIVAKTQVQAIAAAKLVQVKYKEFQTPVLTIKDAINHPERVKLHSSFGPPNIFDVGNTEEGFAKSDKVVEGEFEIGTQYHMYMETMVAGCIPTEDGMSVYCATQDIDAVQAAVASCLNMEKSQVNVEVRRLGGSYGGKITRSTLPATAAAIAASNLRKPVRIQLDLATNMALAGGRLPYYCKYKAGVSKEGLLQAVDMQIYSDCGHNFNEGTAFFAASLAKNCYNSPSWKFLPFLVRTDTPSNTYTRAPGTTQGIAVIENLMEHLAKSCGMDPLSFRMLNMSSGEEVILLRKIIEQVRTSSEYDQRVKQIEEFNANNRWKKRGINLLPMVYPVDYAPFKYNVLVAIYHNGGAVAVSHGGIECGQGINTKVAQVVARELGVPVSLISVKPTNTLTNANGSVTGGSMTSELNCYAAMKACQELNERIRPFKEKMPEADWKTLIETCFHMNVDLTARHYYSPADGVKNYVIHGATVSEVELDLLTGEKLIRRVDLLEDAGQSLNPLLDIGQAEGAFVMGIGLWTSEKIKYDPVTGQKISVGTWNYKPPLNRDIPVDFRVSLLKNAAHPFGVLRSKATGEPPICMSVSVFFAIRNAVEAARKEAGDSDWFPMDGPATVDKLFKLFKTKAGHFSIAQ